MSAAANDPEGQARITGFRQALQKLGWTEGQNLRIDLRWAGGDSALDRKFATELVALAPDVILATASQTVAALQAVARTVPIVFAHAVDPVGAGFVDSLARPGGNTTGFVLFEYGMGAKWIELLKEIAPNVTRVAVLRDPTMAAGIGQFGAIQSVAPPEPAYPAAYPFLGVYSSPCGRGLTRRPALSQREHVTTQKRYGTV